MLRKPRAYHCPCRSDHYALLAYPDSRNCLLLSNCGSTFLRPTSAPRRTGHADCAAVPSRGYFDEHASLAQLVVFTHSPAGKTREAASVHSPVGPAATRGARRPHTPDHVFRGN